MQNKRKSLQIALMVAGALIVLASILTLCFDERTNGPINWAVGASICFALSDVLASERQKRTWLYLLISWVLLSLAIFAKFNFKASIWMFAGMFAGSLFVPWLLFLLIRRLPIKEFYKEAICCAFLPLAAALLTGQWGNNAIAVAIAFVTLPVFYHVTRDTNTKERWIQFGIFLLLFLLTHVWGYLPFVVPRLMALVASLLAVMVLRALPISAKAKTLALVVLMLLSLPLSFVISTNLFAYLVAHEDHSRVKQPFPLSYAFVTKEGDTITEADLRGKNVAVFFWSSHCANCHKELPHFSDLAAQYEDDTTKVFIAAFISFNEATDSAFFANETATERAFIWAKADDSKQIMKDLTFNAFPHITILNKKGEVVYNGGGLSNRPWVFAHHPRKYLNQ